MTNQPSPADPKKRLDALNERLAALHTLHQELAAEHARIAEFSAAVHDEAARVHDGMAHPQLDPAQLRAHAEEDRQIAATERGRAGKVAEGAAEKADEES